MASVSLSASTRTATGKGVARKLRAAGRVPAIIYGHSRSPQALDLNAHELQLLLEKHSYRSTVIELSFDGTSARTLIREVQRHPYKKLILHVDFQELVAGEKVTVRVPLQFTGTAEGVKNGGGVLDQILHDLEISCDPSNIPHHIVVDVTPLGIGSSIHAGDIPLPEGVTLETVADSTVCVCAAPKVEAEPVPASDAAAVAEPELIRKTKEEEEAGDKK
ncbi:MAG TPA: 50S ribosomal protein L25/general stress protein Ctc [Gemmatimonadaceae bacterium]|jgi:large subunit ribosomal protein L25|nr:50S ribosomal protein L25/general stress protein Ctc [Gemmatimonadaceae bacterium]